MAAQIGSLYASLTMDVGPYASSWALADRITTRGASNVRKEAGLAKTSLDRFTKSASFGGIKPYGLIAVSRAFERVNDRVGLLRGTLLATTAVFGGLTAALSSNLILRYADTYNNLTNQIRVVSDDAADLAGQLAGVSAAADNSRSSLQATAVLYSRLAKAAPTKSNSDVLEYVQTIQKALALGGATAQEATSAAIQFSQAIASNRLGGEELRAVLETPLGLALAKGLDVTIGKLRQMSIAGELTADKVLGALSKIKGEIDQQFNKSILTIDQSLVKADNRLTEFIGKLDKTYGLTRIVSGGILAFANNIDTVAETAVTAGLALGSAFGGRLIGKGFGKAIDSTFGEIGRRSAAAKDEVQKLTKAQHDLSEELDRSTRAFGNLQKRDNVEFASKSDLKIVQREEAKLNKIREDRLATSVRLRDAITAAGAVEVKTSKQAQNAADRIVETQTKIEASQTRQITLANELTKAETRLTAAKGQQVLNTANIGAVKEAEKDIITIRKQQIAETTKAAKLEETVGEQRIALAGKIGEAEAKAAEQRSKFQSIAKAAAKDNAKLQLEEYAQTQRLGRARAALSEVGAIGKASEIRASQAALGGLQTSLEATSSSLAQAIRNTSVLRQSFGLLKAGASSLVGFLGGPWGVAFTGAIALTTLLGIRSAKAAQEAENTKKALRDVLGDIAQGGGKTADVAQESLKSEELKGELSERQAQIELFRKGAQKESDRIQDILFKIFDPGANPKLEGRSDYVDLFEGANKGINQLIQRMAVGELQLGDVGAAIKALPEAKVMDEYEVEKLTTAVSEAGKLELAIRKTTVSADQLKSNLAAGVGNLDVANEINRSAQTAADAMNVYEAQLKKSQQTAGQLLFDLKNISTETAYEASIRKQIAPLMKDNKSLLEGEARQIATVNTVLDVINNSSDEWLRSTEATTGEFSRLLAIAKQIAPTIDFSKKGLNATQLAAVNDVLDKQLKISKTQEQRAYMSERERAVLEKQDSILDDIRQKYGTIEGIDTSQIRATAESLIDMERGANAVQLADQAVSNLIGDTAQLGPAAQAAVSSYVTSLHGVGSSLDAFRLSQGEVIKQFVDVQTQTEAVSSALTGSQDELQRLIQISSQSLFGKLENTAGVRGEIAAVNQQILALAQRFFTGKASAGELITGMSGIEQKLKALGADNDALGPFIRSVLTAIEAIGNLLSALGILKKKAAEIGGIGSAGLTGTRTVDPRTGIGVTRFGGEAGANDNSSPTRVIQNGVGVMSYNQTQTTDAVNNVSDGISGLTDSTVRGLNDVTGAIDTNTQVINTSYDNLDNVLAQLAAQGITNPNINFTSPDGHHPEFGANYSEEFGNYDSVHNIGGGGGSFGFHKGLMPSLPADLPVPGQGGGRLPNISVGDININGSFEDGAAAGRQAAYEFIRTVSGAISELAS